MRFAAPDAGPVARETRNGGIDLAVQLARIVGRENFDV
jgi:hypothetical protein